MEVSEPRPLTWCDVCLPSVDAWVMRNFILRELINTNSLFFFCLQNFLIKLYNAVWCDLYVGGQSYLDLWAPHSASCVVSPPPLLLMAEGLRWDGW